MKFKIERVIMSGRGVKYTYLIRDDKGIILFQTSNNSYWAWTRKKDAQRIVDGILEHGLEYIEEKLDCKAYLTSESIA